MYTSLKIYNPSPIMCQASWLDARNICRSMCMDLISVETPEENLMVEQIMSKVHLGDND